jgi:hypothetical protein
MRTETVTVVVGPAGVGKTVVRRALRRGLEAAGVEVAEKLLFPASLSLQSLLGSAVGGENSFAFPDHAASEAASLHSSRASSFSGIGSLASANAAELAAILGVIRLMLLPPPEMEQAELEDIWTGGGVGPSGPGEQQGRSSTGSVEVEAVSATPPGTSNRPGSMQSPGVMLPLSPLRSGSLQFSSQGSQPGSEVKSSPVALSPSPVAPRRIAKTPHKTWLVLDGPLVGPQASILFPLIAGGHLYHSSAGGKLSVRPGIQVI